MLQCCIDIVTSNSSPCQCEDNSTACRLYEQTRHHLRGKQRGKLRESDLHPISLLASCNNECPKFPLKQTIAVVL
jgi:hypothetical protein